MPKAGAGPGPGRSGAPASGTCRGSACRRPPHPAGGGCGALLTGLPAGTGVTTRGPASSQEPGGRAATGEHVLGARGRGPAHLHASARGARASVSARAPGETEAQPAVASPEPHSLEAAPACMFRVLSWQTCPHVALGLCSKPHTDRLMKQTPDRWKGSRVQRASPRCQEPAPAHGCSASLPAPRGEAAGAGFNCSGSRA